MSRRSDNDETAPLLDDQTISNRTYVENNDGDNISVISSSSSSSTEASVKGDSMNALVAKRLNGAHLFVILIG